MIQIEFKDGSTLMELGESADAVVAAVRSLVAARLRVARLQSACHKLNVEFWAVTSIKMGEVIYGESRIQEVRRLLALQDALVVLQHYVNFGNWSRVFNRQKTVQRRWKGRGESGYELALNGLDRLQHYAPPSQGVM